MLLPVSLVGSYPQPDWLIDRAKLAGRFPPRVRARATRYWPSWARYASDSARGTAEPFGPVVAGFEALGPDGEELQRLRGDDCRRECRG